MKVNGMHPHDLHAAGMRPSAKAGTGLAAKLDLAPASPGPTGGTAPPTGAAASAALPTAVESTLDMAARRSPPGLVRVAARLEAMGADGRTAGQSQALAQITRNLQRYADAQGAAAPSAAPPAPPGTPISTPPPAPAPAPTLPPGPVDSAAAKPAAPAPQDAQALV
jgi:hypothetical protein